MAEKITESEVRHVARLSRLVLSEPEIKKFTRQLANVLDYFQKLNELNVYDVEPMAHAMDLSNVLRADQAKDGLSIDQVLANAPDQAPPFFKVPKVLGEGGSA